MNYQKNKKYFSETEESYLAKLAAAKKARNEGPTLLVSGVVMLLVALFGFVLNVVVSFIFIIIAVICFVASTNSKDKNVNIEPPIKDSEYDAEIAKALKQDFLAKAFDKLGLDQEEVKEADPIILDGFDYKHATLRRKGKDGVWRTNKYEVCVLLFSAHEIHRYTYRFCTTEPNYTESTDVYFYTDIVSVSTDTDTYDFSDIKFDYEYFKIVTKGGTSLDVAMRDYDNSKRSINAMRTLLREKKQD